MASTFECTVKINPSHMEDPGWMAFQSIFIVFNLFKYENNFNNDSLYTYVLCSLSVSRVNIIDSF